MLGTLKILCKMTTLFILIVDLSIIFFHVESFSTVPFEYFYDTFDPVHIFLAVSSGPLDPIQISPCAGHAPLLLPILLYFIAPFSEVNKVSGDI